MEVLYEHYADSDVPAENYCCVYTSKRGWKRLKPFLFSLKTYIVC
jgi:hypothetical protein